MKFIWTFEHFSFHNLRTVRQRDIGTFTLAVLGSVLSEWQISAYFEKQMVWRNKTTRKLGGGGVVGQTWPAVKSFFLVYFIEDHISPSLTSRCLSSDGKRLCVCLILYVSDESKIMCRKNSGSHLEKLEHGQVENEFG